MPSLISPNISNYFIGRGVVLFKPELEDYYYFLGNVITFEFSPTLKNLDHFSSQTGVKTKDDTVVLEKGGTVKLVMEELTARNLALFLVGDVDMSDPDFPEIEIFGSNLLAGALRFVATNEIGPRWTFDFARVEFSPTGKFDPIATADAWGNLEVTGTLAVVEGSFGKAVLNNLNNEGVPINIALPAYTPNTDVAVGDTLTTDDGTWLNADTFTYAWFADGVAIPAATTNSFTVTTTQLHSFITAQVTATNVNGAAIASGEPQLVAVTS